MIVNLYVMGEYKGQQTIDDDSICGHLLSGDIGKAIMLTNMLAKQCCQSTNHHKHRGELWQCENCHKWVCENEGTDNHPELCDSCWAEKFYQPADM